MPDVIIPVVVVSGLIAGWFVRGWWTIPALGIAWAVTVGGEQGTWSLDALSPDIVIGTINAAAGVGATKAWRAMFLDPRKKPFPKRRG